MYKRLSPVVATLALSVLPAAAHAQYKNSAFGLDVGAWLITKPTVWNTAEQTPLEGSRVPLRLQNGVRVGGESNFKMDDDHFWFTGRVNVGFLQFPDGDANGTPDERFDAQAHDRLGTLLGVQGSIGVRYVFLTDRVRPYLQATLSAMRLFTFNDLADGDCTGDFCTGAGSNQDAFLPHPNVGGVHLQPGVELIIKRNLALHLFVDVQRWLILNATDNNAVVLGVGLLFFS